jgi:plasmid stabilization system protein ParE
VLVSVRDLQEVRRNGLGHELLVEVEAVFKMIEDNPLRHAVMYRNVRRALVRKFPYKVFYHIEADTAEIIGVVHAKRHPRFWQQRV